MHNESAEDRRKVSGTMVVPTVEKVQQSNKGDNEGQMHVDKQRTVTPTSLLAHLIILANAPFVVGHRPFAGTM